MANKFEHWFKIVIAKLYACCNNNKELADKIASHLAYANKEFFFKFDFEMDTTPIALLVKDEDGTILKKISCSSLDENVVTQLKEVMNEYARR